MSGITISGIGIALAALVADIAIIKAEVVETEKHFHNHILWLAAAAAPNGELHVADRFSPTASTTFQINAGNITWGAWVQILGSSDTPVIAGMTKFDPNGVYFTASQRNTPYIVQFGHGASGAAALTANEITEVVYTAISAASDAVPIVFQSDRHDSGTKLWARCFCPGANLGTLNFYIGLHEYVE
jgi:hypothetical protein